MSWHVLHSTTAESLQAEFALDVLTGLSERPKRLSSRWLYDDVGSELFRRIMAAEDYYPTEKERWVLEHHGASIAAHFAGRTLDVVDLGAGDGAKTQLLLRALQHVGADVRYVPIDISEGAMATLYDKIAADLPELEVQCVVGEYVAGLRWLASQDERQRLVLFLGSNIGNFDKPRARAFLRRLWSGLRGGDHLLVGFDLKKDIEVLLRACNDSDGVTAAFNPALASPARCATPPSRACRSRRPVPPRRTTSAAGPRSTSSPRVSSSRRSASTRSRAGSCGS